MLTPEFLPISGGVGTYVLELARRMPAEVELHVVAPSPPGGLAGGDRQIVERLPSHVSVHHLGSAKGTFFGTFPFQINCAINVRRMVEKLGINLIHSQSSMPDLFLSPERTSVPTITTIHTTLEGHIKALRNTRQEFMAMTSSEKFAITFHPLFGPLEDRYYSSTRRYITVSEWGKKEVIVEKRIPSESIRVIYNGVDPTEFSPSHGDGKWDRLDSALDSGLPIVLYFSRLVTRKGINVLAKAVPEVLKKVECHFIFGGRGTMPSIPVESRFITHLGYVPSERTPHLYAKSDVFVLPSFYENFPISILEAMASGCSVVASDVCGIPEMIDSGVNGVLVKPGDVTGTANAIARLIEDGDMRDEIGRNARAKVRSKFSWETAAKMTVDYYYEILSGSAR